MQRNESKLTVFFDGTFWVGVYERICQDTLEVCKITFGPGPKDYEVYEFLLKNLYHLLFSPPVKEQLKAEGRMNPKRLQRMIRKQVMDTGVSTKAQQAMKLQQTQGKEARKKKSRLEREEENKRQFDLKQTKKKKKHRGH